MRKTDRSYSTTCRKSAWHWRIWPLTTALEAGWQCDGSQNRTQFKAGASDSGSPGAAGGAGAAGAAGAAGTAGAAGDAGAAAAVLEETSPASHAVWLGSRRPSSSLHLVCEHTQAFRQRGCRGWVALHFFRHVHTYREAREGLTSSLPCQSLEALLIPSPFGGQASAVGHCAFGRCLPSTSPGGI